MKTNFTRKISVIIPAYNEEDNISILMEKIDKVFKESSLDAEVVFVNDGSTDKTAEEINNCAKKYPFIVVTEHKRNRGLTQSLATGFAKSKGEVLIFFPADLQYLPEDIPKLLSGIDQGYDIVTAWRQAEKGRRLISIIYNYFSRKLFNVNVHDTNSIKAMRREVMEALILSYDWHRYLVVLAANEGFKISEVKINVYPRRFGKSKFGMGSLFIGIIDLVAVKIYTAFSKKPSLLFGVISFIFLILSAVITCLALTYFLIHKDYLIGISLKTWILMAANTAILGILFFLIGYIAELVTHLKIRMERLSQEMKEK